MPFARWQSTIVDEFGNIVQQPTIEVKRETVGQPLATLYSDRDGAVPLGNPFTLSGGANGFAAFHVAGGAYQITVTKGLFSRTYRYVAIGLAGESDALVTSVREALTVSRNYYVRTDGSDSNTGLANNSGGAFLTVQKAIDTAATLDTSIYGVTINVGAGTFSGSLTLKDPMGAGLVIINGAGATTIITSTNTTTVLANGSIKFRLQNLKIENSGGTARGIYAGEGSYVRCGAGIEFGAVAAYHVDANTNSVVQFFSSYTVSGGGLVHWSADNGGKIIAAGITVTLSGTPAFSSGFALASNLSLMRVNSNSFTGAATGKRYSSTGNSVIYTNSGSGTYLPGSIDGTTSSGGQYT